MLICALPWATKGTVMPSRDLGTAALLVIACAVSMPAVVDAASLRMVIQIHPDLEKRCIDVPYSQFVVGMRLQMWDCNNGNAQTFVYDEQEQSLKIGGLCVESWGRGDPQDAVGLGVCNGNARQHWRMAAFKEYYQIVGVNNLCLELRSHVKANSAALDIYNCDVIPQRLWTLVEAPR
jgi:hypothetical protein